MAHRRATSTALIAVLLGLPAAAPAQLQLPAMSFTVAGTVYGPDGRPVSRASVTIRGANGFEREISTDTSGRYELRDIPRGRFQISAENLDVRGQTSDPVTVETTRMMTQRLSVHVYLRDRPGEAAAPEGGAQTVSIGEVAQQVPSAARKHYEKALKLRSKGRFDLAIDSLDKAIELYPDYFQALSERGHLLIGRGRADAASTDFERALAINGGYEPALRGSGICRFSQQRFAESVRDLERATALASNIPMSYLILGMASIQIGRSNEARSALQRALTLDPISAARAHVHLAELDMREGRYSQAIAEIDAYLTVVPGSPDAARLRGIQAQLKSAKR